MKLDLFEKPNLNMSGVPYQSTMIPKFLFSLREVWQILSWLLSWSAKYFILATHSKVSLFEEVLGLAKNKKH